jgi:CheY-like chemotaxis protein
MRSSTALPRRSPLHRGPRRQRRGTQIQPKTPVAAAEPAIVLIADDDEGTRIVLQRALTKDGYIAIPVDDGGEIWPILDRENVVALVLDLKMPGVNGWEVLRRLREDFRYRGRRIRVIVVSGQADRESREFALRLGADQFFAKPFDLDLVRRALLPNP